MCCIFAATILAAISRVVALNRASIADGGMLYDVPGIWPINKNITSAFSTPEFTNSTATDKVIIVVMIFFFMLFPKLYITIVILSKRCNYKHNRLTKNAFYAKMILEVRSVRSGLDNEPETRRL